MFLHQAIAPKAMAQFGNSTRRVSSVAFSKFGISKKFASSEKSGLSTPRPQPSFSKNSTESCSVCLSIHLISIHCRLQFGKTCLSVVLNRPSYQPSFCLGKTATDLPYSRTAGQRFKAKKIKIDAIKILMAGMKCD